MPEWPAMTWYDKHYGQDVWMVCRNGHLWSVQLPKPWELDVCDSLYDKVKTRAVSVCALCRVLKQAGQRSLRGIRAVHPDWLGVIQARKLLDGTIEHHHPEQVAQVFSPERVEEWVALKALLGMQNSWGNRAR